MAAALRRGELSHGEEEGDKEDEEEAENGLYLRSL